MARGGIKDVHFDVTHRWATSMGRVHDGGIVQSSDGGSTWLFRSVPMGPVVDARSPAESLQPGSPLMLAFDELAELAPPAQLNRRRLAKSGYRRIHLLRLRVPAKYVPPAESQLREHLSSTFHDTMTTASVLLIGIQLKASVRRTGWRDTADGIIASLTEGVTPVGDFMRDARLVGDAMTRCGLQVPTAQQMQLANSWWADYGQPDPPYLMHADHLHSFSSMEALRAAAKIGPDRCTDWDNMPGTHALSFATVAATNLSYVQADSPSSHWMSALLMSGAQAISVRGLIEPPKVTREELRRMRKGYQDDIRERLNEGKMERTEQLELEQSLQDAEAFYAQGGTPTLTDTSVLVAFSGRHPIHGYDPVPVGQRAGVTLYPMVNRQQEAWSEMMPCSKTMSNPYLLDLPAQTISFSGLPSLSVVGDKSGAQPGFTETDNQPVFIDHMASVDEDTLPIAVIVGQSGSGKAMTIDTRLRTPSGWTTFGLVDVGDKVIGSNGLPCTVLNVTTPQVRDDLLEVTLNDGQSMRVDGQHQFVARFRGWPARGLPERLDAASGQLVELAESTIDKEVVTAPALARELAGTGAGEFFPSTNAVAAALAMMDVRPGTLGRYRRAVALAALAARLKQRASHPDVADGWMVVSTAEMISTGSAQHWSLPLPAPVAGSGESLVTDALAGWRPSKALPERVIFAPVEQRRELLLDLIRGHGSMPGDCEFAVAEMAGLSPEGVESVLTLARSLGVFSVEVPWGGGVRLAMTADGFPAVSCVGIETIDATGADIVCCIEVDSPDSTFLVDDHVVTHNTQTALFLADQYARMRTSRGQRIPIVFVDPKLESNHSRTVARSGGTVFSLDRLITSDGVFDPIRFAKTAESGASMAASIILEVNPFGSKIEDYETELIHSLNFGASNGARCTMEALAMAETAGHASRAMVDRIEKLVAASTYFRAMCGSDPEGTPLQASEGITYIMLGSAQLNLPDPDAKHKADIGQRTALVLVKAMVYGSMMALAGREGIVILDEGWIFLEAGKSEVVRAGRLARSWQVWLLLLTQRVKEVVDAEIQHFISRGGILPMEVQSEAIAACRLFGLEPTAQRLERITGKASRAEGASNAPNWNSMRALRDDDGNVLRGSIMLYCDQKGRAVPVEVKIPPAFLGISSTSRKDMLRRDKAAAAVQDSSAG